MTGEVAILQLHLLLGFGDVSVQSFGSVGHKGSGCRVGFLHKLPFVPCRQVEEVGVDGWQVHERCQSIRSEFA